MSELKVINAYQLTTNTEDSDVYIHNDEFGCGGDLVKCYLKSEADKVITELKNEIETQKRLRDMALASVPNALKVAKIIQHNKYKRCLAMAKWCFTKSNYHFILFRHGEDVKENYRKSILYSIWRERWLELAEEPTWEKFLQLIHKVAK